MHLETQAIICAVRSHGEHGAIVRALTPGEGIQPGYVRGGKSRRLRPVLVPGNLVEASSDLGASPGQTFRNVLFPLALPGIVAGSIFTFSLTLGDYIIPQIIGTSRLFIGQAVYSQQGTAGNIPLAAAFTVVPIVIMGFYLWGAKRMGAFDAL